MSRFIELHWLPSGKTEAIPTIQNMDEISRVYQKGDNAVLIWKSSAGVSSELGFRVTESYEEVKRMLMGGEAQKVPWEAD